MEPLFSERDLRLIDALEYDPTRTQEPATATILAALQLTNRWLASVGHDDIGLLTVG